MNKGKAVVWHDLEKSRVRTININIPENIYKICKIWPGTKRYWKGVVYRSLATHGTNKRVMQVYGPTDRVDRQKYNKFFIRVLERANVEDLKKIEVMEKRVKKVK